MEQRYGPLSYWFNRCDDREVTFTFREIEKIIRGKLPPSARAHRSWWGNDISHSHAASWLEQGFEVTYISMEDETVTFGWSRLIAEMAEGNSLATLAGSLGMRGLKKISITDMKRVEPTCKRDQRTFEAVCEGLRRAGTVHLVYDARVYEPPLKGRRTEPGYGSITLCERHKRPFSYLKMIFADGRIYVSFTMRDPSVAFISKWPKVRELSAFQYIGLWQQTPRFLVAWPTEEWQHEDKVELVGALVLKGTATPHDALRVVTWLLREADAFEGGLRKLLTRKRALSPVRALGLADKHLARYVRPPAALAKCRTLRYAMNEFMFIGSDEAPTDTEGASLPVYPPPEPPDPAEWEHILFCRRQVLLDTRDGLLREGT